MKNKITFTDGQLAKFGEYYDLKLFNNGVLCYKATLSSVEACKIIEKHKNIIII